MTVKANTGYRKSGAGSALRMVVLMPKNEANATDGWGIPAGMLSRTPTIRILLKKGLETVKAQENRQSAG